MSATGPAPYAALAPRIAALMYEGLLLGAVLWSAGVLYAFIEQQVRNTHSRAVYQLYLLLFGGVYFVGQWCRGQTLPMRTWHLRLVTPTGDNPALGQSMLRYIVAIIGVLPVGAGFLWALIDRERQFLHDRIAGTRIVRC